MSSERLEKQYIADLKGVFEAQGSHLYEGHHTLCLTNHCLNCILKKLIALQQAETSIKTVTDLQCIGEGLSKVKLLKLITDRKYTFPQSLISLDVSPFKSLQSLTLKRVPFNSISGLQRLREQLCCLVIEKCGVCDIEDVIVKCGRDEARPFVWNCLKELDLSANSIKTLGGALQYLPALDKVSFSSNKIGETDVSTSSSSSVDDYHTNDTSTDGIKYIESVSWLHLGFNRLTSVPRFGDKAKYFLTTLILRNNSLTDIEGIEVLEALKELDVAENIISVFTNLKLLIFLKNLSQLTLMGNPVTFDPNFRMKTAQCLSHTISVNTFLLDNKKLSSNEKKVVSHSQLLSPPRPGSTTSSTSSLSLSLSNDTVDKRSVTNGGSLLPPGEGSLLENGLPIGSTQSLRSIPIEKKAVDHTSKRPSVARSPRLITFEENEAENQLTTPLKHGDKIKRDQNLRSQLRASWLTISNISSDQASNHSKRSLPMDDSRDLIEPSKDQPGSQYATETQSHTTGIGYSIIRTQSETTSSVSNSTNSERTVSQQADVSHDQLSHDHIPVVNNRQPSHSSLLSSYRHDNENDDIIAINQTKKKKKNRKKTKQPHINGSGTHLSSTGAMSSSTGTQLSSAGTISSSTSIPPTTGTTGTPSTGTTGTPSTGTEYQFSVSMPTTTVSTIVPDNATVMNGTSSNGGEVFDMEETEEKPLNQLSDPKVPANYCGDMYQVVLYDSASEDDEGAAAAGMDSEVLMILSDRFIQEVTLNGDVQDQLDLQCLTSARVKTRRRRHSRCRVLVLHFNYERRDRRKREYILPTYDDESKIMKMLEPIVDQNTADVSIARKLECLKCQVVIDWSEALDDPTSSSPSPLTPQGSFHSQNKICPRCKEGFLVFQTGSEHSGSQKRSHSQTKIEPMDEKPSKQSFGFNTDNITLPQSDTDNPIKGLLSSFHMNVEMFDTYPEVSNNTTVPSDDPSNRQDIQGSPLPDVGPFGLSLDRTPRKEDMGVVDDNYGNAVSTNSTPVIKKQEFGRESSSSSPVTNVLTRSMNDTNPFSDDDPLYSKQQGERVGEDVGVVFQSPTPEPPSVVVAAETSSSSKSLSWSHFKPGVDSVEPDSGSLTNQSIPETKPSRKSSSESFKGKSSGSNSPLGSRKSPVISASVPSENAGFMSLFRRTSKDKRSTHHSRTKSQDLQKIPPLPEHLIHGGVSEGDPPTPSPWLGDSPLSSQFKSGSQSSVTSEGRGQYHRGNDRCSSGEERKCSSGSGSGRFRFSVKRKPTNKKISKSSSEAEEGGRPVNADFVLYRNKDPAYLHSNLVLHMKMSVFSNDNEEFQLALRSTVIEYGAWIENESFLIISSTKAYLYKVIGPENLDLEAWLELVCVLELSELVYIEIGVCYQSLRLEFDNPPRCYTFMIGIEELCRKIFDSLSYIVSDVPNNLFKSIRVTQFSLNHLTDPHEVLRQQLLEYYDSNDRATKGRKPSSAFAVDTSIADENLEVFVLGQKYNYNDKHTTTMVMVTLVLTDKHLYMGVQNPQWPFPALHLLPDKEDLLPPFSGVIQKEISDVEGLVLFEDHNLRMTIKFFYEGVSNGTRPPSSSWTIILKCSKSMKKFVNCLKSSWHKKFELDLPVVFK